MTCPWCQIKCYKFLQTCSTSCSPYESSFLHKHNNASSSTHHLPQNSRLFCVARSVIHELGPFNLTKWCDRGQSAKVIQFTCVGSHPAPLEPAGRPGEWCTECRTECRWHCRGCGRPRGWWEEDKGVREEPRMQSCCRRRATKHSVSKRPKNKVTGSSSSC